MFPFEDLLNDEDIYYSTLLGIAEMLQYGTVSVTDMYGHGQQMAEAFLSSGMKCNLGLGTTAGVDQGFYEQPRYQKLPNVYSPITTKRLTAGWRWTPPFMQSMTSNPRLVAEMAEYTKAMNARCHIHLSETKAEQEACLSRHGKTPAQYFNDLGVFDSPTTAAHCVWLTEQDVALLAKKNVTVASCPVSNLKLASGFCNIPALQQAGINVALGTDSAASNNNLDMIEEMKVFAISQKAWHQDPTLLTVQDVIYAATRAGALSQGRSESGLLQVGYQADLAVLDLDAPNTTPCYDLKHNLVYAACGKQVCLTMVDGEVLYRDGQFLTLDMEKIVYHVERSKQRILNALAG